MSIMEYNGGTILAMAGKNCVAMAGDLRFGVQNETVGMNFSKVFHVQDHVLVGLAGLATDVQTMHEKLNYHLKLYNLREERPMSASVTGNLLAHMLYERRFGPYFTEPLVAGLEGENGKPYLVAMDLIGAPCLAEDFVCSGTGSTALYGMAESLWRPDMNEDELFEVVSQCLLAGLDRSADSGWGAEVHLMTPTSLTIRKIKNRMD